MNRSARQTVRWIWVEIAAQLVRCRIPAERPGYLQNTLGRDAVVEPFADCFTGDTKVSGDGRVADILWGCHARQNSN